MFTIEFYHEEKNVILRKTANNIADAMDKGANIPEGAKLIGFYFPGQEPKHWSDVKVIDI